MEAVIRGVKLEFFPFRLHLGPRWLHTIIWCPTLVLVLKTGRLARYPPFTRYVVVSGTACCNVLFLLSSRVFARNLCLHTMNRVVFLACGVVTTTWRQEQLLPKFGTAPGARCGVALCAFAWVFYFVRVNMSSNCLPFGSDATMLLPRYLAILRGQYIAAFMALVVVP